MSAATHWAPEELGDVYVCDRCDSLVSVRKRGGPYRLEIGLSDHRYLWDLCPLCARRLQETGRLERPYAMEESEAASLGKFACRARSHG